MSSNSEQSLSQIGSRRDKRKIKVVQNVPQQQGSIGETHIQEKGSQVAGLTAVVSPDVCNNNNRNKQMYLWQYQI